MKVLRFLKFTKRQLLKFFKMINNFLTAANYYSAAHEIVTPFSGFLIADYYYANEIDQYRIRWLNPRALRINLERCKHLKEKSIIYCQSDQLEKFAERYLPLIKVPFILVTGKWHYPGIENENLAKRVLENSYLVAWFSQNQIFADLEIHPFPYGVQIEKARVFTRKMDIKKNHLDEPLIPFSTIHDHTPPKYQKFRVELKSRMNELKPFDDYLQDLKMHKYVICTPGDRPDTYRHWETLASGAIPVLVDQASFQKLFGESALYVEDFSQNSIELVLTMKHQMNSDLVKVSYWKEKVNSKFNVGI